MKILYLASGPQTRPEFHPLLRRAIEELGDLTVVRNGETLAAEERLALYRQYEVLLLFRDALPLPAELATDPGKLRHVSANFGTLRRVIGPEIIASVIQVTNWGDAAAESIAEGAMVLLLAVLKDLPHRMAVVGNGGWEVNPALHGGSLLGLNVGVYGCGYIGRRFIEMLQPFRPIIRVYDPYLTDCPAGCTRANSLKELFGQSQAVVIHAGLTEETRGTVTAELLAKLPDHGIIINTARGAIIDQEALFQELATGRLRAGLDVLEPDGPPPADHPGRRWDNCILTAHQIHQGWPQTGAVPAHLSYLDQVCLDNLRRFRDGQPLRFRITPERYQQMT